MIYPPNGGFTQLEEQELRKLDNNEHLKNALRKIIVDSSAGVLFDLLTKLDGVAESNNLADEWTGVRLIDQPKEGEDIEIEEDEFGDIIHDELFALYWD